MDMIESDGEHLECGIKRWTLFSYQIGRCLRVFLCLIIHTRHCPAPARRLPSYIRAAGAHTNISPPSSPFFYWFLSPTTVTVAPASGLHANSSLCGLALLPFLFSSWERFPKSKLLPHPPAAFKLWQILFSILSLLPLPDLWRRFNFQKIYTKYIFLSRALDLKWLSISFMFTPPPRRFTRSSRCFQIPSSKSASRSLTQASVPRMTHSPESLICSGAWKEGIMFHWKSFAFSWHLNSTFLLLCFIKDCMFYSFWSRHASKQQKVSWTLKHEIF